MSEEIMHNDCDEPIRYIENTCHTWAGISSESRIEKICLMICSLNFCSEWIGSR